MRRLPGDPTHDAVIARMIRVNQAGEYGAKRIYQGQLAVLKRHPEITRMAQQEEHHLDTFNAMMVQRRVRPTLFHPLWHLGAWLMGAGTALLGEKAAMACTAAVESVIDEHYANQLEQLDDSEPELKQSIAQFRQEEIEHHDIALEHGAEDAPFYDILRTVILYQTKLAIWLSSRL